MLNRKKQLFGANEKLDVSALHKEAIQKEGPCTARVNTPQVILHTCSNTNDQIRSRGYLKVNRKR